MLADYKFEAPKTAYNKVKEYQNKSEPPKQKTRTWNDVKRSNEPFWRSNINWDFDFKIDPKYQRPLNNEYNPYANFNKDGDKIELKCTKCNQTSFTRYSDDPKTWVCKVCRDYKNKMKCTKCGKEVETVYVDHPSTFICRECPWT